MSDRGVLGWILVGLIVGVAGRFAMPKHDPGGFIVTILLGIAGALFAGFVVRASGWDTNNMAFGWGGAALGGTALLLLYRIVMHSRVK